MSANVAGTSRIQITGGTVNGVIGGGLSYAYGTNGVDWKSTASVGKSEVIITGGTIEAVNYVATGPKQTLPVAIVGGGVSWSKDTISGENPPIELTTTTSSSSVVIDGATVKADIVGGGYAHQTGSTASVENASLSISNATLGSDSNKVNIYAGGVTSGDAVSSNVTAAQLQITATTVSGDVYTGGSGANSTVGTSSAALTDTTVSGALNFEGSDETSIVFAGVNSVGSVTGTAQSYAFNAADEQTAAVLTVKEGAIDLSEAKSIRAKAKAGQTLINGSVTTGEDTVVVVETPTGDFTYNVEAGTGDGMGITSGGLQIGESTISGKGEANTNSKTLSEAFLGSVAFVNQGAEFIADEGLNAAVRAAQGASGFTAFGAIHGGKSRYETGSHVDLRGTSLAAGAAGRVGGALIAGLWKLAGHLLTLMLTVREAMPTMITMASARPCAMTSRRPSILKVPCGRVLHRPILTVRSGTLQRILSQMLSMLPHISAADMCSNSIRFSSTSMAAIRSPISTTMTPISARVTAKRFR